MMTNYRLPLLGVCGVCLLMSSPVLADGLIRDGIGPISIGRGGTNIAHADNSAVLLDNPAGIINIPGDVFFEAGIEILATKIHYRDQDPNDTQNEFGLDIPPQFSYIRKSSSGRWAYGIGVFLPAGFSAEYNMNNPILGFQKYRSLGILAKILPAVAYQVNDRLSVGATLGVGVSHIELEGPFFFQTGALAGTPAIFDMITNGATITWSVGMQYKLSECTVVGLKYESQSKFVLAGKLDVDVYGLGPDPVHSQFDVDMDIVWPRSVGLGITHLHNDCHRLSADVIWYDWSDAFDNLDLTLTDSTNPLFTALLGPTIKDRFPLNWRDSISLRLGYEFFTNCCDVWRVGYIFHPRPVPNDTLNPYLDGVLEHAFSVGHSTQWGDWRFNTAYQYSFGPKREVGTSKIVGGDFDNSSFRAEAHWVALSLSKAY